MFEAPARVAGDAMAKRKRKRKKKRLKKPKDRSEMGYVRALGRFKGGAHKDKKLEASRQACRKPPDE